MLKISILICTYNRAEILQECLESFAHQSASNALFEVIIINNNSNDNTEEIVQGFVNLYSNFRLVLEEKQGLSHARNRGYKEAKADWVSYVDDDAKAYPNYVERALWTISNYDFDCFGGIYLQWYKYGKPKWLSENFGTNKVGKPTKVGVLKNDYASGGVIVFKKKVLEVLSGFPTNLGMDGEKIAYGEETLLQIKLIDQGFLLGFDPQLKIDHLVAKYKLNPMWHIKSLYAHGRDGTKTKQLNHSIIQLILRMIIIPIFHLPLLMIKVVMQPNYYWQNLSIDLFGSIAHSKGCFDQITSNYK